MTLRTNPGRQRRRTLASNSDAASPTRPPATRTGNCDYYDDSDDEKGHKSHDQMYNGACSLGRFCLNPCLCLATTARMICCRPKQQQVPPYRARRRSESPFTRCFVVFIIVCIVVFLTRKPRRRYPLRHQSDWSLDSMPIMIKMFDSSNDIGGWHHHNFQRFHSISFSLKSLNRSQMVDFNGLIIPSLRNAPTFRRSIADDNDIAYEVYKKKLTLAMDEKYRGPYYDHPEETFSPKCRPPNFKSLYFPSCNGFHEFDLSRDYNPDLIGDITETELSYYDSYRFRYVVLCLNLFVLPCCRLTLFYLSAGYYRDAWMLKRTDFNATDDNSSVLKTLRLRHPFSIEEFMEIQKDALVMERLTFSPRILNMFGHCAMSILVEPMPFELEEYIVPGSGMMQQVELDKYNDVHPMNDYTVPEKLEMALAMAESIADLHGYEGGVIVHNDIQLCQWLRNSDDKLVFGDFNRAEVMDWNSKEMTYCMYSNGYVYGNYRSPEEMRDDPLDEKIDIYSFGNNLYALLTGLWVFYENDDDKAVQEKVTKGQRAFIDERYRNRSHGEGKLVELMERCWNEEPSERVDIFEAVRFLREAIKENNKVK